MNHYFAARRMSGGTLLTIAVLIASVAVGSVVIMVALDQHRREICDGELSTYNTNVDLLNMSNQSAKGLKPLSERCLAIELLAKKPISEPHEFKGCLDVYRKDLEVHPGKQRTLATRGDLSPSCQAFVRFLFDEKAQPSGGQENNQ